MLFWNITSSNIRERSGSDGCDCYKLSEVIMFGKKPYTYELRSRIDNELPQRVKDSLRMCGWNAFGIYELVATEIKREKLEIKQAAKTI